MLNQFSELGRDKIFGSFKRLSLSVMSLQWSDVGVLISTIIKNQQSNQGMLTNTSSGFTTIGLPCYNFGFTKTLFSGNTMSFGLWLIQR